MAFDQTNTPEDEQAAKRLAILATFRNQPAPIAKPLDYDAIKARADELYAAGFGKNQAYDGLGDAIALAGRLGDR